MDGTSFTLVYDSFFSKITDDMYMQLDENDTYAILQQLLISAIQKFEFPRINLWNYDLEQGKFNVALTSQEINILAVYMIVEWLSQQLATVQNTRMKYSGSDFKFTSQANHMHKILQLKKDYEREGFHLQRLYKRRFPDKNGIMRSTFGIIMKPNGYTVEEATKDTVIDYNTLINKPKIESNELIHDKTFDELGMSRIDFDELESILSS